MLSVVGAGDSPVRGNVRVADKRVPESGEFPCPSAVQMSEIRNQRSEAVQAGFTQSRDCAINRISYPVGAGLRARPSGVRKGNNLCLL